MAKDAQWWRDYRKRKRERKERATQQVATPTPAPVRKSAPAVARGVAPVRVKRMKSDAEIRAHIANAMRSYSHQPQSLLLVLTGYVAQLQELMKRDHEDALVDRACAGHHPGKPPTGMYCKLCHDIEMSNKYGSIPGATKTDAQMAAEAAGPEFGDDGLEGVVIKKGDL